MTAHIFQKPDKNMTVREGCERVLARYESGRNYGPMRANLNQIAEIWGDRPLRTVAAHELSAWAETLRGVGAKPATINRKLSAFSVLLRTTREEWGIPVPEFKIKRQKEKNGRIRWLTAAEENKLLVVAANLLPDFCDLLIILIDTGMRLGEALSLRLDSPYAVKYEAGEITLEQTKTDVPRTIPMTERVLDTLKYRWSQGKFTWDLTVGQVQYMWSLVRRAMKLDADPDFVIHSLRHTFASRLVQAGVDLYRVSKLLGHSSIKTTERYAHLSPLDLHQAVQLMESIHTQNRTVPNSEFKP